MNRTLWRELRVFYNNHDYLPESHFWYTSLMRRQNTICSTRDRLKCMSPSWRIGSRAKPNGGYLQQVLPVSPIFIDTCHFVGCDERGTSLFEGYMYCRNCLRDKLNFRAKLQKLIKEDATFRFQFASATIMFSSIHTSLP